MSDGKKRVAIIRLNEIERDPRTRRVADLLNSRGHEVRVYTYKNPGQPKVSDFSGYKIFRFPLDDGVLNVNEIEYLLGTEMLHQIQGVWPGLLIQPSVAEQTQPEEQQDTVEAVETPIQEYHLATNHISFNDSIVRLIKRIIPNSVKDRIKQILLENISVPGTWSKPSLAELQQIIQEPVQEIRQDQRSIIEHHETEWRFQFSTSFYREISKWATHVYCCDLDTLITGVMLKRNCSIPLIYDAYEIFPYQWDISYRSAEFTGFYTILERLLLPYTDERITVGTGLAKYFEYTHASKSFEIVPSTPSAKLMVDEHILYRRNPKRGILYHGAYAPFRGLDEFIDVVPLLDDCRIAFRGIGNYEKVLKDKVKSRGLQDRIEFLEPVTLDELIQSASEFDIGLLPFVNSCLNTNYAYPNKLFEYMMAGLAIATNDLVDQRCLVEQHYMGVVFDIHSPAEVANRINYLLRNPEILDQMRCNAWTAAQKQYNWEESSKVLNQVLDRCGL